MKRFLLFLVALVVTSVCFAQDVIVQKDGNTITAKILKVSQSEVEYKKFNNQNGPTYTISTKDLQCINYENGTKDTFVSENYNPNIVTNETATQFSNDQELLKLYSNPSKKIRKGKRLRNWGWVLCAAGVTVSALLIADCDDAEDVPYELIPAIVGVGAGVPMIIIGNKLIRNNSIVQATPIYQQEFNIGKSNRLMVGVDMLKDNTRRNQTLGLGVSYNF